MLIHAFASAPHYRAHLEPIMAALGKHAGQITNHPARLPKAEPVLVAAHRDLKRVNPGSRPVFYVEHGAGQTYLWNNPRAHPAYSGGKSSHLSRVAGFIAPSSRVAANWLRAYPRIPAVAVGCPKLDWLHRSNPQPEGRLLAWTFHWNGSAVAPEAGTALPDYRQHMPTLVRQLITEGWDILGHAHPRWGGALWDLWESLGVAWTDDANEVLRRASLLVADNTSLMYEFASLGRPVVALAASTWRREAQHGLRFWDAIPGWQVDNPGDLVAGVAIAEADPPHLADQRARAVRQAYFACDGRAAERASRFVLGTLG